MKKLLTFLIVAAILSGIMWATNPDETVFRAAVEKKVDEIYADAPDLLKATKSMVVPSVLAKTKRDDYSLFSIYRTEMMGDKMKFVGIFKIIIPLQKQKINEWKDVEETLDDKFNPFN